MKSMIRMVALLLGAVLMAPALMAQNSTTPPSGGQTSPTGAAPATPTPLHKNRARKKKVPRKMRKGKKELRKGKKELRKGKEEIRKGEKMERKGRTEEKKGLKEEKAAPKATAPAPATNQ